MSVLNYKCISNMYNIEILDNILELLLKLHQIEWYNEFCFAAHELLINSVEAMSKQSTQEKDLHIEIIIDNDLVTFSVSDTAGGLKKSIENILSEYDFFNMADNGRGLFMIHSLVDNFTFNKDNDGRYKYTINKKRIINVESEEL